MHNSYCLEEEKCIKAMKGPIFSHIYQYKLNPVQ